MRRLIFGPASGSARSVSPPVHEHDGPAVEARQLSKRYPNGIWALRSVDLEIPQGAITALVGPNGAGKSTLIRSWVGFERPTEGTVSVFGLDPWQHRRAAVLRTAYLSQAPSLYRDLSVEDHLELAATLRRSFDLAVAMGRLAELHVPLEAKPTELSGGQQAQVGLAIALGTRAPVLLLDEPLASLDPLARREFLAVLTRAVREDGSTAVISSHIVTDVEAACDRIVVLGGGRVLLNASLEDAINAYIVVTDEVGSHHTDTVFEGPFGQQLILARRSDSAIARSERQPSLEEVVIGLLAIERAR